MLGHPSPSFMGCSHGVMSQYSCHYSVGSLKHWCSNFKAFKQSVIIIWSCFPLCAWWISLNFVTGSGGRKSNHCRVCRLYRGKYLRYIFPSRTGFKNLYPVQSFWEFINSHLLHIIIQNIRPVSSSAQTFNDIAERWLIRSIWWIISW